MGELADAVESRLADGDGGGHPHTLVAIFAVLPPELADDLRELFDNPHKSPAVIRRAVMALCPEAPVASESAWWRWAREWRRQEKRF